MSIIVKGMQMPKNCAECPVALSGKYCRINKTHTTYIKLPIRPDHCPLVELPEKHGRLIDADYVVEKIRHELGIKDISFLYNAEKSVVNQIFHAPTILKAEGVEE